MSSSAGIIIPNIWKVIKTMFQTTNQQSIEIALVKPSIPLHLQADFKHGLCCPFFEACPQDQRLRIFTKSSNMIKETWGNCEMKKHETVTYLTYIFLTMIWSCCIINYKQLFYIVMSFMMKHQGNSASTLKVDPSNWESPWCWQCQTAVPAVSAADGTQMGINDITDQRCSDTKWHKPQNMDMEFYSEWEQTNFTRASQINCLENVIKVVPNFAVGFVDIPKTSWPLHHVWHTMTTVNGC